MSTQEKDRKVQAGPNLRAAIAQLPATGGGVLTRDNLDPQLATPGDIMSAVNDRCVNELPYLLDLMAGVGRSEDGPTEGELMGAYHLSRLLKDELRQIGRLAHAIWRDENGMDVPERWS